MRYNLGHYPILDSTDSLAVADGVLYIGSSNGAVYALSANSGDEEWSRTITSSINSLAIADIDSDGQIEIIIGGNDGVFALNKNNGDLEWSFTNVNSVSSIVIVNEIVYAGSTNGAVYAIDGSVVSEKWSRTTYDSVDCLAVADGVLYVGSDDGAVYALSANSGDEEWSRTTSSVKSLAIADIDSNSNNDIIIGTSNKVSVLNTNNGDVQWELNINQGTPQLALADIDNDGKIEIVTTAGSVLSAIDSENGNNPPNRPIIKKATNDGKTGYEAITIDPDGDQIYYYFDWGDGTNSGWLGPYNSGEPCFAEHSYTSGIKVKAKDTDGAESDWSEPTARSVRYDIFRGLIEKLIRLEDLFQFLSKLFA